MMIDAIFQGDRTYPIHKWNQPGQTELFSTVFTVEDAATQPGGYHSISSSLWEYQSRDNTVDTLVGLCSGWPANDFEISISEQFDSYYVSIHQDYSVSNFSWTITMRVYVDLDQDQMDQLLQSAVYHKISGEIETSR